MSMVSYAAAAGWQKYATPENLKRAKRAAETIWAAYKEHQGRKKRRVGDPVHSSTAEASFTVPHSDVTFTTRNFGVAGLINIERDKGNYDKRKRFRDIVNVRGVKWCWVVRNNSHDDLRMHYAIVKKKDASTPTSTDFLADIGGEKRYAAVNQTGYTDFHLDCLPINTDEYYIVTHKKFLLPANRTVTPGTFVGRADSRNYIIGDKYIKINRQLRFVEGATEPINQLYVVWWAYKAGSQTISPSLEEFTLSQTFLCYFRSLV